MKRPRYIDFKCLSCGNAEERFAETNDDNTVCDAQVCGQRTFNDGFEEMEVVTPCGIVMEQLDTTGIGYMKTITKGNHDFNERERERLEKCGDDHWRREGRHEAIERERTMLKKNGMEGAGGVE